MEVVTNQKGERTSLLDGFAYTVERERSGKICVKTRHLPCSLNNSGTSDYYAAW